MTDAALAAAPGPVPMLLFCPACGVQHVDTNEWATTRLHRSHLCKEEDGGCGHVWRPADVHTVGVAELNTQGAADGSPVPVPLGPAEKRLRAAGVSNIRLFPNGKAQVRDSLRGGYAEARTLAGAVKKLEAGNG